MALIIHVLIATVSLLITGFTFFFPSDRKLTATYVGVALTIASGTYLVWTLPASMVSACESGLIYLGVVIAGILATRHKLASAAE